MPSEDQQQQIILSDVHWILDGDKFDDLQSFELAVRKAQIEFLDHDDDWHPEEIIVEFPAVRISFMCEIDGRDVEEELFLESSDPKGFSTCELLFKIHNAVVEPLCDDSHNFFEGLCYNKSCQEPDKPPIFHLGLGS